MSAPHDGGLALLAAAALLVATASCTSSGDGKPSSSSEGRPPAAAASMGVPLEALVGDCPVDSSARHADPVALVEEFVRRDAEGPFERAEAARRWEAAALTCVERAASDHYEVIRTVRVRPGRREGDSATVMVDRERLFVPTYDDVGRIIALESSPGDWVDTVLVINTSLGWRIHDISGGAHRLPQLARSELRDLQPSARRALDSLLSRPGP